jgi:hypothetical protein
MEGAEHEHGSEDRDEVNVWAGVIYVTEIRF